MSVLSERKEGMWIPFQCSLTVNCLYEFQFPPMWNGETITWTTYLTGLLQSLKKIISFVTFLLIWWCQWKCFVRCQAYYIFISLQFACFSKSVESRDKSKQGAEVGPLAASGPTQEKKDFRLKVTKPSIMKEWKECEPQSGATPCLCQCR